MGPSSSGLNFQQAHFSDPLAPLQASLGAGGLFAKTLQSISDQNENRLKMHLAEKELAYNRERQAIADKISKENHEIALSEHRYTTGKRAEDAKEKAYNSGLQGAINESVGRSDLGSHVYDGLVNKEKTEFETPQLLSGKPIDFKLADSIAGIDRSKLSPEKQALYDSFKTVDSDIATGNATSSPANIMGVKLGKLTEAYALDGSMGNIAAQAKAATALGLSKSDVDQFNRSNYLQNEFNARLDSLASNDPLFGRTKLDSVAAWKEQWAREHPGDSKYTTDGAESLVQSIKTANGIAIAKAKEEANKLAVEIENERDKNRKEALQQELSTLNTRVQIIKGEGSSDIASLASIFKHQSSADDKINGSKVPLEDQWAGAETRLMLKFGVNDQSGVHAKGIHDALQEARSKMYSPLAAESKILNGIRADGVPEEREPQKYKYVTQQFTKQNVQGTDSDSDAFTKIQELKSSIKDENKDQILAMYDQYAKKYSQYLNTTSNGNSALKHQLADSHRTPMQSFIEGAHSAGRDFAYDENIAGHQGIANKAIAEKLAASETLPEIPSGRTTGAAKNGKEILPVLPEVIATGDNIKVRQEINKKFDLPKDVISLSKSNQESFSNKLFNISKASIINKEGERHHINAKGHDLFYDVFNVTTKGGYKDKNGVVVKDKMIPHVGNSVVLSELNQWMKGIGAGLDYSSAIRAGGAPAQAAKEYLDKYQNMKYVEAFTVANRIAKKYSMTAEAIPQLSQMVYQLGAGAETSFAPTFQLIKQKKTDEAISHIRGTAWINQTKDRAHDFIDMIKDQATRSGTGSYVPDYVVKTDDYSFKRNDSALKAANGAYPEAMAKLKIKLAASNDNVQSYAKAYNKTHITDGLGSIADIFSYDKSHKNSMAESGKHQMAISYIETANQIEDLKKTVARYPKDIATVASPEKRVEMRANLNKYDEAVARLHQYENALGVDSSKPGKAANNYMKENGIKLYDASYRGE